MFCLAIGRFVNLCIHSQRWLCTAQRYIQCNNYVLFNYCINSRGEYNKDIGAMLLLLRGGRMLPGCLSMTEAESLDIERFHSRRAIFDLEQVAPLVDGGLLRTFTIDGESV